MIGWILGILMWIVNDKNDREGFEMDMKKDEMKNRLVNAPILGRRNRE